ncbi:MAG: sigma 54-interacting transcriptional regulator [Candidatus Hydrogenedentes bacterium]|nr:sigma 54-interacting transcriptional regulator [Candidatus Hydrogenedentota bacterium]
MVLFDQGSIRRVEALARLNHCNPFSQERIELEREVLGGAFVSSGTAWHREAGEAAVRPNIARITNVAEEIANRARESLQRGESAGAREIALYESVVLYLLYNRYESKLREYIESALVANANEPAPIECYDAFCADMAHYLNIRGYTFPGLAEREHLFACFFQLRRAFHHIFDNIIGGSTASAQLRAATWQSIFTCDMARYRRTLYSRMNDVTTLITGPSGTGKELVARAIAYSGYIPFDARRKRPVEDFIRAYHPVNLSELSPTLIESELFGHVKGAFTGAMADRAGYFEICHDHGTVFLDELGELDPFIQVKLLRVVQDRTFRRVGETTSRPFRGKIVAATNRDLTEAVRSGRFREDLYYRLCSDTIQTPSLREQIAESREQLRNLIRHVAQRVAGEPEARALAEETDVWIWDHLPADYPWPGNVRELEQCVRNIMVRKSYVPTPFIDANRDIVLDELLACRLTAEELLGIYCRRVYEKTGSYSAAAKQLGLDRRTVKSHISGRT